MSITSDTDVFSSTTFLLFNTDKYNTTYYATYNRTIPHLVFQNIINCVYIIFLFYYVIGII